MNPKLSLLSAAILLAATGTYAAEDETQQNVEKITVSGDFHGQRLDKMASSIAVISSDTIRQRGAEHLEDVLNTASNINFASGASHARFFQVRGIGERSEFVDSVNPSVGVMIDGIDYSGIGTVATLFDVDQVEIFRGPNGTRFGSNAMAGMINLKSHDADGQQSGKIQMSYGNYNSWQAAAAHGMALTDDLSYRAVLQHKNSDGYMENTFLGRDDTNNLDESSVRLKLRWQPAEVLRLDLVSHYFDFDNGYDAFSLDNTRQTLSDQPGFDKQRTRAMGFTGLYSGFTSADVTLQTSYNNSDLAYGYDEDWSHPNLHANEYASFDHYFREHDNQTIDLRATAKPTSAANWVAGIYRQDKQVDLERLSVYGFTPLFQSRLKLQNLAAYGQRDWQIDPQVSMTTGLRVEQNDIDYQDTVGTLGEPKETMWGGNIDVRYQVTDETMIYGALSRGYKNGGINGEAIGKALVDGQDTSAAFLQKRTTFEPETLHNIELGIKGANPEGTLQLGFSVFYAKRKNIQLKGYVQESDNGETPVFVGYIENGASGKNYGLESDLAYQYNSQLTLFANIGLLHTEIDGFIAQDGTDMSGRDQAHAPQYQYNVGAAYQLNNQWLLRANFEGKDEFYYSMSHNAQSESFDILNLAVAYQSENWDLSVWGRNVTDEEYGVRGFYFGNDPRDGYTDKTYTQLGEPARYGATFNYHF